MLSQSGGILAPGAPLGNFGPTNPLTQQTMGNPMMQGGGQPVMNRPVAASGAPAPFHTPAAIDPNIWNRLGPAAQDYFYGKGQNPYGTIGPTQGGANFNTGFQGLMSQLNTAAGPDILGSELGYQQKAGGIGFANQQIDIQSQMAQNQAAQQMGSIKYDQQGNAIQQGGAARNIDLTKQLYMTDTADLKNQRTSLWQNADVANRQAMSSATARGAINSLGLTQGLGDISNNLTNQLTNNDLSQQRAGEMYQKNLGSLEDQQKMLQVDAGKLGLNADTYKKSLDLTLKKYGLDKQMNAYDLVGLRNSADIQQAAIHAGVTKEAMNIAYNNPGLVQSMVGPDGKLLLKK